MYKVTKKNKNYPATTLETFHRVVRDFGGTARISNMFEIWKDIYDIDEFMLLDLRQCQNSPFEAYLMDRQLDWMNGEEVDLTEVYESILTAGDFTTSEKRLFQVGKPEERIWGILLAITDPTNINNI